MKTDIDIPCGASGEWRIEEFIVTEEDAKLFNLRARFNIGSREIEVGKYKKLLRGETLVMSNTPSELDDHSWFISIAEGNILVNGLGLGEVLVALLKKKEVKSVTVIELSEDVIKLVAPHFSKDKRVNIIQANALEWKIPKGTRYDCVWHDIWDNICSDNLEEMKKLHRKFGRHTKWQSSWCRDLCERYRGTGY